MCPQWYLLECFHFSQPVEIKPKDARIDMLMLKKKKELTQKVVSFANFEVAVVGHVGN